MPRLIFKCPYIKGGAKSSAHLKNYVGYIAAMEMAQHMKIPWEQFRWYAAFHDAENHPHIHMVCYSKDPSKGFLTKQGIAQIKSDLAIRIFRQELTEIYSRQTQRRDEVAKATKEKLEKLIHQMKMGAFQNDRISPLMEKLSQQLKETTGKKQYGYLKAPLKKLVDEIVNELEKEPCVSQVYSLWYDLREEVLKTYKDDMLECLPLSQQKEFRRIKNIVVQQAVKLGEPLFEKPNMDTLKLVSGVTRLLRQVGNFFQEEMPPLPSEMAQELTDHKLRRKIQEKKEALGHKME